MVQFSKGSASVYIGRTRLMNREQVDDEGMVHAGERVDLGLDDDDGLLLEDRGLGQHLHLGCWFVRIECRN